MSALWFAALAVVAVGCSFIWSERRYRQRLAQLAERRDSPDKLGFVAMMRDTADPDVAEWLWEELLPYWRPTATPHPDDDFVQDLPIDPEEPNDWLSRFCASFGLAKASFPHWPNSATTVRNLAAWFSEGRRAQQLAITNSSTR